MRVLSRSPQKPELLCAPGNAGIARDRVECADVAADDVEAIVSLARERRVDLVVVGPEAPLVAGVVDALAEHGIRAFGPSAEAARLEGSKRYAKELMREVGVPTAGYAVLRSRDEALSELAGVLLPGGAEGRLAGRGQGRDHLPRRGGRAARRWSCSSPSGASATPRSCWRSSWRARSCRCWRCATASARWRWRRPRTTSGSATATPAPTPAAWAATRPCRASTASTPTPWRWPCTSRSSTSCAAGARPTTACSTRA